MSLIRKMQKVVMRGFVNSGYCKTVYKCSWLLMCLGTDATHAEHIETIKARLYVGVRPDGKFVPGELGMGLVEGQYVQSLLPAAVYQLSVTTEYEVSVVDCRSA